MPALASNLPGHWVITSEGNSMVPLCCIRYRLQCPCIVRGEKEFYFSIFAILLNPFIWFFWLARPFDFAMPSKCMECSKLRNQEDRITVKLALRSDFIELHPNLIELLNPFQREIFHGGNRLLRTCDVHSGRPASKSDGAPLKAPL